uniref:protein-tyrosine-phosphatase n=1 Tax=Scophthalmus maximus TaxID=52904 RepID=A0A8D3DXM0_SCOMX
MYMLKWQDGGALMTTYTNDTFAVLSERISGTHYTIPVVAVAGDNSTQGDPRIFMYYTKPEPVQPSISSQGSNSSVLVSWNIPAGKVAYFEVSLNSTYLALNEQQQLNSNSTSFRFETLLAGTLYTARVITYSGPFSASSGFVTNATFPNPPGSIEVLTKTPSSIEIRWMEAPLMTGASFVYKLTITPSQAGGFITATNTSHTFDSLVSGTSYNISIVTVGVMDFESEEVHIDMVSTRPYSIRGLELVTSNTTTVLLNWTKPLEYKTEYTYQVQTTGCGSQNKTVAEEMAEISELNPGTNCTFCVSVIAAGENEGEANCISQYTKPEPVQPSISSQGSNSSVLVSWNIPPGKVAYFEVSLNSTSLALNERVLNSNSTSFRFETLSAGTLYTARVITYSGPFNASSGFVTNATFPNLPGSIEVLTKTPSSIEIRWMEAPLMTGASFVYKLTITPSQAGGFITATNTSHTFDSLVSGTSYNISIVTVGVMDFESEEVHIYMVSTRPYSIRGLEVVTSNTTTVLLNWTKPLEYKTEYTYQVQATGCGSQNKTVAEEMAEISELIPGTNCTFCVSVIAAGETEGEANCISQYTKPEPVQPSISSQGSNSSVLVSWNIPAGKVAYFEVSLSSTSLALNEQVPNSNSTSFLFETLSAGTLYTARVITYSGPFSASSGFVTNATLPNPPGSIEVLTKTPSSIEIRWMEAPLMARSSFFYKLTLTSSQPGGFINTTNTSHTFRSLLPGTSYNISIVTVGVMDFESEKVHIYMVSTKQLSVESVVARAAQEDSMTVTWEKPADYEGSCYYNLNWQSRNGVKRRNTTETVYTIYDLDPGTRYNVSVTPGSDGRLGATTTNSSCTNASPVKGLTCHGPNKANAEIVLSWTQPSGQHSGFLVTVKENKISNWTDTCCNLTVFNLHHDTTYHLTVKTLSCGQSSTPVSLDCRTGITDPPIPPYYESLLVVSYVTQNKFSIQINRTLLDGINGRVTHVGVLVTESPPVLSDDTSILKTNLGKTYDQWRAKETHVYLATVIEAHPLSRSGENPLNIEVGDGSTWEGYTNGALDADGKYQYAIAVFTSLILQNGLVNGDVSLVSVTNFSPAVTLPPYPADIGIAIGATLGIFSVFVIVLIGFIIYWKRFVVVTTDRYHY